MNYTLQQEEWLAKQEEAAEKRPLLICLSCWDKHDLYNLWDLAVEKKEVHIYNVCDHLVVSETPLTEQQAVGAIEAAAYCQAGECLLDGMEAGEVGTTTGICAVALNQLAKELGIELPPGWLEEAKAAMAAEGGREKAKEPQSTR
jgi:hypothetical protein